MTCLFGQNYSFDLTLAILVRTPPPPLEKWPEIPWEGVLLGFKTQWGGGGVTKPQTQRGVLTRSKNPRGVLAVGGSYSVTCVTINSLTLILLAKVGLALFDFIGDTSQIGQVSEQSQYDCNDYNDIFTASLIFVGIALVGNVAGIGLMFYSERNNPKVTRTTQRRERGRHKERER